MAVWARGPSAMVQPEAGDVCRERFTPFSRSFPIALLEDSCWHGRDGCQFLFMEIPDPFRAVLLHYTRRAPCGPDREECDREECQSAAKPVSFSNQGPIATPAWRMEGAQRGDCAHNPGSFSTSIATISKERRGAKQPGVRECIDVGRWACESNVLGSERFRTPTARNDVGYGNTIRRSEPGMRYTSLRISLDGAAGLMPFSY